MRIAKGPAPRLKGLAPLLLLAMFTASCIQNNQPLMEEINQLRHDSIQSRKEIDTLKGEVAALKAEASARAAAPAERSVGDEVIEALRASQTNLFTQVSAMSTDMRGYAGKLDELRFEEQKGLQALGSEIDIIRSKLDDPASAKELPALRELSARITALEEKAEEAPVAAPAGHSTQAAAKPGEKPAAGKKIPPERAYKEAYELYEKRQYQKAREKMQAFVKDYPEDKLAGNAMYWIGETYYAQKQYSDAILAYQDVLEKQPQSPKVPAAMLKQSYAFIQMGDRLAAKGILRSIIERYPKTETARLAEEKLKEIK